MSADLSADFTGQPTVGGRSAGLSLNLGTPQTQELSSNNPFRNRAVSPNRPSGFSAPSSAPRSPFDDPDPAEPTVITSSASRNPFLDPSSQSYPTASYNMASSMPGKRSPTAEELFDNLNLEDKPAATRSRPDGARGGPMRRPSAGGPARGENNPPRGRGTMSSQHRPSRSQEEALRARRAQDQGRGGASGSVSGSKTVLESPQKRYETRRPRRNSDSTAMDIETTEEKQRRRERDRERERERRARGSRKEERSQVSKRLDLIDQLDATSIYGTGLFHHDGPFDALNPHRNRQGSRRAPMQAFPEDSINMSLGGAGPLNSRPDHATFMGHHDDEAHKDWNVSGKDKGTSEAPGQLRPEVPVFDPVARGSIIHGAESMGLGTSTFLEGAPAARSAIQRRQQETAQENAEHGLQRKKSLAQRIRSVRRPSERDGYKYGRNSNTEGVSGPRSGELPTGNSISVERDPFFNEFDRNGEDRITVKRNDTATMKASPAEGAGQGSGVKLERRATTDSRASDGPPPPKPASNGLMARVKSLKGGRKHHLEGSTSSGPGTTV